jgi:flagellar basal body-associated protein FliL
MAKNKKKKTASGNPGKQQRREADARAKAQEEKKEQERAENARKSAQLGSIFLYAILCIIAVFCVYTLIRTLLSSASSVSELRDNWLFVSLVTIPYLILTAALVIRKLRKKRREEADKRSRRLALFIFLLIVVASAGMFFVQLYRGRTDASRNAVYAGTIAALQQDGRTVTEPEEVYAFRSLLEYSLETELTCGETAVALNYHAGSGLIAGQFVEQVRQDYAAFSVQEETRYEGKTVLRVTPVSGSEKPKAALCVREGSSVTVWELTGPESELLAILEALETEFLP